MGALSSSTGNVDFILSNDALMMLHMVSRRDKQKGGNSGITSFGMVKDTECMEHSISFDIAII